MNSVQLGDCIAGMNSLPAGSVDLAFADPPFNIGYDYDVYDDRQEKAAYLNWSREWISAVHRVLKPDGTFWLAIGDEYAAELKLLSQEVGFTTRSWVIWYYTFGVNCKQKFTRSHAHLFHFVKDPKEFTFRSEALENRVPSARQLVYNDRRGNPTGRLPDDTWILRPQDLNEGFTVGEDTWYLPRVAGTFKERAGFHGCQMPEQLLARIIRICSNERDLVLDPFSGSATTLAVAKKLGRRFMGFDLSPEYVKRGTARLSSIKLGDRLEGDPEPLVSAPATHQAMGKRSLKSSPQKKKIRIASAVFNSSEHNASVRSSALVEQGIIEAFAVSCDGYSADRVVADPDLFPRFTAHCVSLGLPGRERDWGHLLFNLRKAGKLSSVRTTRRTELPWEEFDKISVASEIAMQSMLDRGADSLDDILCDPELASQFDAIAQKFSPDSKPLWYRWAALKLRKEAGSIRTRAKHLRVGRLSTAVDFSDGAHRKFPDTGGLFVVLADNKAVYVGEALNLRSKVRSSFSAPFTKVWRDLDPAHESGLQLSYWRTGGDVRELLGYQSKYMEEHRPKFNYRELAAS